MKLEEEEHLSTCIRAVIMFLQATGTPLIALGSRCEKLINMVPPQSLAHCINLHMELLLLIVTAKCLASQFHL